MQLEAVRIALRVVQHARGAGGAGGQEVELGVVQLRVPGRHNVLNALAAVSVGLEVGIPFEAIASALDGFRGAERRFQLRGEERGVMVVDDYGHHPTEIAAVIAAARAGLDRRVVVVFQPHRYTRTRDLLREFGTALGAADEIVLTDIYAAGEAPIAGVTAEAIEAEVRKTGRPVRLVKATRRCAGARWRRSRGPTISSSRSAPDRSGRCRIAFSRRWAWPMSGRAARRRGSMAVKAPAEKNFRRAKVRPGSRRGGWTARITWRAGRWAIAVAVVLYAGYRGSALVLQASGLQVRRISVHGNVRLSSGEVASIVDGLRGANILTADLAGYRRRLLESPWVADVALRRVLPSTVEVFVSERRPMGLCRLGSALYLIDPHGTLIDEFGPQYSEFDLPIIDGLVRSPAARPSRRSTTPAPTWRRAADRRAGGAQGHARSASRRSTFTTRTTPSSCSTSDGALLHLGEDKFLERLQSYVDLAPALRQRVPDIDYVDLRFDQRVYVRPASTTRK